MNKFTPDLDTRQPSVIAKTVDSSVANAISQLRAGRIVAMPTDTVYGLAASLDFPAAIAGIFALKGRPSDKPIPVLIDSIARIERFATSISPTALRLMEKFWPGALTVIVPASTEVPDIVLAGGSSVGLRMPSSRVALSIIAGAGGALAVSSANRSGQPDARSAHEVRAQFGDSLEVIVDGGTSPMTVPSTVIEVSGATVIVARSGALDPDLIFAALEEVRRGG